MKGGTCSRWENKLQRDSCILGSSRMAPYHMKTALCLPHNLYNRTRVSRWTNTKEQEFLASGLGTNNRVPGQQNPTVFIKFSKGYSSHKRSTTIVHGNLHTLPSIILLAVVSNSYFIHASCKRMQTHAHRRIVTKCPPPCLLSSLTTSLVTDSARRHWQAAWLPRSHLHF